MTFRSRLRGGGKQHVGEGRTQSKTFICHARKTFRESPFRALCASRGCPSILSQGVGPLLLLVRTQRISSGSNSTWSSKFARLRSAATARISDCWCALQFLNRLRKSRRLRWLPLSIQISCESETSTRETTGRKTPANASTGNTGQMFLYELDDFRLALVQLQGHLPFDLFVRQTWLIDADSTGHLLPRPGEHGSTPCHLLGWRHRPQPPLVFQFNLGHVYLTSRAPSDVTTGHRLRHILPKFQQPTVNRHSRASEPATTARVPIEYESRRRLTASRSTSNSHLSTPKAVSGYKYSISNTALQISILTLIAVSPVPRLTMKIHDSDDQQTARLLRIQNPIRKSPNQYSPNPSSENRPSLRQCDGSLHCCVHLS